MNEVVRDDAIVAGIRSVPSATCGCLHSDAIDGPTHCDLLDFTPRITSAIDRLEDLQSLAVDALITLRKLDISPSVVRVMEERPYAFCEALGQVDRALRQMQIVGDNVILGMLTLHSLCGGDL